MSQNSAFFHAKSLGKNKNSRPMPKHSKSKPVSNIKLSGEKLETIPLKSGTSQGCSLFPYLFNIVLEFVARAIRQQKGYKLERKKSNYHYLQMMIVYLSDQNTPLENSYS